MADESTREVILSIRTLQSALLPEPQKLLAQIRARVPGEPHAPRAANLVVALDRSGSMQGPKLRAAIATLGALAEELGPGDTFCLLTFSDKAHLVFPPAAMTSASRLLLGAALSSIRADGGTDLSAAVLACLKIAREHEGSVRWHAIVLTDGYPTVGVKDEDAIVKLAAGALGEASLSMFGYGQDVRPELLARLAELCRGSYHFVPGTEPPVEAFAAELGRQRSLVGVEATLELTAGQGVSLGYVPVLARVMHRQDGRVVLEWPALLAGDSHGIVVGVQIEQQALLLGSTTPWLQARLRYRAVADGKPHEAEASLVPVLAAAPGAIVQEVARDLVVQRLAELVEAVARRGRDEVGQGKLELLELVSQAGLERDPQLVAGFALLSRLQEGLGDEKRKKLAEVAALSAARGIYRGEVTGLGMGPAWSKEPTQATAARMRHTMTGSPKKPDGELN